MSAEAQFAVAVGRLQAGDTVDAERICTEILAADPGHADSHHLMGIIALQRGDAALAAGLIANAVRLDGGNATYLSNLSNALGQLGKWDEAVEAAARAVAINPHFPEAHNNLGVALHGAGRRDDAAEAYGRAGEINPTYAEAFNNLGGVLQELGRRADAVAAYGKAIAARPGYAEAHSNLGAVFQAEGRLNDAIKAYGAAVTLAPGLASAHFNLGNGLQQAGRLEDAVAAYTRAIALDPDHADARINLAKVFFRRGQIPRAISLLEQVITQRPALAQAHSNLLYAHSFQGDLPQEEILTLARRFNRLACPPPENLARRISGTKLNVGIISAEIGSHAVARFLESFLRHYDRGKIHLTLYQTVLRPEAKRLELLALADSARDLSGLDDASARQQIMADQIDILIDTSGHLADNRLPMLAQRCAAIQAHYNGYHGTTGITAMDCFIGDDEITPLEFQPGFSETLIRLPRLWVAYAPPLDAPTPEAPTGEAITFGCFNILSKAGPATLDLWGRVMKRLPASRLVLKYQDNADPVIQARVRDGLAAHGVSAERITFLDWVPDWRAHMALYNTIDVALDTIPLNSGTTGFDALYMATPLVALRGHWMGGRMSSAMLKALGHPEWIAETPDDYVAVVERLVTDRARLRGYKQTLRAEMLASPLCDGKSLATALEDAFAQMVATHNARLA